MIITMYNSVNNYKIISDVDILVRKIIYQCISLKNVKSELNRLYYPFMTILDDELAYSQPINAFISTTNAIVGDSYPFNVSWDNSLTESFIRLLLSYKSHINYDYNKWYSQGISNSNKLENSIRKLFIKRSRLLFVRVDLKYFQEVSDHITIYDFDAHMQKLRDFIGNKKTCFGYLLLNAWSLEQGEENGSFHCHLLLVYDGSERYSDTYLAMKVGEKWQEITEGLGYFFNLHTPNYKKRFEYKNTLGIDMIHRSNIQEVENAVNAALYLTRPFKSDDSYQRLKVKLPGMRTFGKSIKKQTT